MGDDLCASSRICKQDARFIWTQRIVSQDEARNGQSMIAYVDQITDKIKTHLKSLSIQSKVDDGVRVKKELFHGGVVVPKLTRLINVLAKMARNMRKLELKKKVK